MSQLYLILHNIRSTHNVGSIFRTADGFGVEKIYLTGYTPGPYDFFGKTRKEFQKTALGTEKSADWSQIKNIHTLIKRLKKEGIKIVALEQSKNSIQLNCFVASRSNFALRKRPPINPLLTKDGKGEVKVALILGNEVRGIPKGILKSSDAVVEIPMRGKKESFNVAVAAGIALWEISNKLLLK